METEQLIRRLKDLANKAYMCNIQTFSHFLSAEQLSEFCMHEKEFDFVNYIVFGGTQSSERVVIGFGLDKKADCHEEFPISCIHVFPKMEKFSDNFSHRDFLGALMNLGIERYAIGDILLKDKHAYVFCQNSIATYILENLTQVKHTSVKVEIERNIPEAIKPVLVEKSLIVSSERIDSVVGKLLNISRSQGIIYFQEKKVFVNGKICENNSYIPKKGDVITVRGFGKFIYEGVGYETKKGKCSVRVLIYS